MSRRIVTKQGIAKAALEKEAREYEVGLIEASKSGLEERSGYMKAKQNLQANVLSAYHEHHLDNRDLSGWNTRLQFSDRFYETINRIWTRRTLPGTR